MNIIRMDLNRYNFVSINHEQYFILHVSETSLLLTKSKCPHKGGPLHLGHFDEKKQHIVCPWHEKKINYNLLKNKSLPVIRIGNTLHIFLTHAISLNEIKFSFNPHCRNIKNISWCQS